MKRKREKQQALRECVENGKNERDIEVRRETTRFKVFLGTNQILLLLLLSVAGYYQKSVGQPLPPLVVTPPGHTATLRDNDIFPVISPLHFYDWISLIGRQEASPCDGLINQRLKRESCMSQCEPRPLTKVTEQEVKGLLDRFYGVATTQPKNHPYGFSPGEPERKVVNNHRRRQQQCRGWWPFTCPKGNEKPVVVGAAGKLLLLPQMPSSYQRCVQRGRRKICFSRGVHTNPPSCFCLNAKGKKNLWFLGNQKRRGLHRPSADQVGQNTKGP